MNLWTCSVREGQRRPGRALLTLLGITLGLATVVATRLTTPTVGRAYRDLFEGVTGQLAVEVTAPGQGGLPEGLVSAVAVAPGVKDVLPRIQGAAGVVGKGGALTVPVLGVDPQEAAGWALGAGLPIGVAGEVLLSANLAEALGLAPGQAIQLWAPSGLVRLHLAGTLAPQDTSANAGGRLVVSLATAQRLFNLPARVNRIRVVLEDGASPQDVRAELLRRLPPGLIVQPPGAHAELARSTLQAAEQGLAALSVLALVTAGFVILNTFLLNLGERRRQFAILRTLGATRHQVLRMLLGEALLLGLAGTVAGCGLGVLLALALLRVMEAFLGIALPHLRYSLGPFVIAVLLGPGIALSAAWLPISWASRRPPLAELLPQRRERNELLPRWIAWLGLLALALGLGLALAACRGWLGWSVLSPALALLLGGGALALPELARPVLRLARALPLGLAGALAVKQLARQRSRTGLTAGVLFLAVAVSIGFGHSLRGILRDLHRWYHQTIVADFLVRAAMPDTAFILAVALPETVADEIGALDDVEAVDRLAFLPAEANGRAVLVLARTFPPEGPLPLDLRESETGAVRAGLWRGEAVLGAGLAEQLGLGRGDAFVLTTSQGAREVRIAGIATELAAGGAALYLEWSAAQRLLDVPGAHVFLVSARPGAAGALAPALRAYGERRHLLVQSNADLRALIDNLVQRVTGAVWALLVLVFVVATLGIVNTMRMNVEDQARDLGVLRALGLVRGQLYRVVLAQALLLAGLSVPPGALAGGVLAYVISRGSAGWTGLPISFRIDLPIIGGCGSLALASALLASLLPAWQASRQAVLGALR